MFKHIYFNSIKIFIREKEIVFWLMLFPMILAIFFKLGFSKLDDGESFEIIPVVLTLEENIQSEQPQNEKDAVSEKNMLLEMYKNIFSELKDILDVKYTDAATAKGMLEDEKVAAWIYLKDDRLAMDVAESEINQSIVKEILDNINEVTDMLKNKTIDVSQAEAVLNTENYLHEVSISGQKQDFVATWFYTILGMAAMYGSMLGVGIIKYTQANQSAKAMRVNLAPIPKMTGFCAVFAAGASIHSVIMTLIYLYLKYVMNINFGDRHIYIILTSVIGGITGISIGAMVSVIVKAGENMKIGICMAVSMLFSYLSGMMDNTVKYEVMKNAPFMEYVNPAELLTDSYLKLYYYEDLSYYYKNIINLLVIMAICMAVTILILRRQRYDSI